jgi:tetratricopeptide (TPR) repeat protein
LLLCHGLLILPFTGYLRQRPLEVKLGYLPHPQILKLSVADHGLAVAEAAVVKVLFYFGTLVETFQKNVIFRPEYPNMYRTLQTAAQLDPYNMDNYYFAQAAFTWEIGRVAEVNALLEQGMKYRTWDPWLPFYIGFNRAYFLKDYIGAAPFMQLAAERSGNPLFTKLAARYFYESRQTELGLIFLDSMIAQAKDKAVKATYQLRRDALLAVSEIERALAEFRKRQGRDPSDLHELVATGLLPALPADPYGGTFYLDVDGRVRSTSKLADHER